MKVIPVGSQHAMTSPTSNQTDARSKAIAAFNKSASQSTAGVNPNQVLPEELPAVTAPKGQPTAQESVEMQEETSSTPTTTEAEVTAPKPIDPETAKRFAQLARESKALQAKREQQEAAFKQKEAEIAAREAKALELESRYKSGYISQEQLKQNALQALADAGVSYDELTQQILNQQPTDPRLMSQIQRQEETIRKLEEKLNQVDSRHEETQKQAYQNAVKQIRGDAQDLIEKDSGTFELIKATDSIDDVVEYIELQYQKTGRVISVQQAAEKVEEYLTNQIEKYASTKKIQERIQKAQASASEASKKSQPPAANTAETKSEGSKTLTNAMSTGRKLTAKERAILAFKGELKS